MLRLMADIQMTRRKRFFFVLDEAEALQWSGQTFGDAIAWLHDQGHYDVILDTGDQDYDLHFTPRAK